MRQTRTMMLRSKQFYFFSLWLIHIGLFFVLLSREVCHQVHCLFSFPLVVRVVEEAADRVFMAARLFVRFFNQRGGSLQQRILELLELADAADQFHKKTVTASVGGGVASVAGSITTITGLILAPFTAGTSLIVTAVGIGVATAGGVASASANITDTVHSKTDRKKVEAMIQRYQEEIKDIKECLEFLQVSRNSGDSGSFRRHGRTPCGLSDWCDQWRETNSP